MCLIPYNSSKKTHSAYTGPLLNPTTLNSPGGTVVKNLPAKAEGTGDVGSIPGLGRSPEVENGNPLQYFCLENPMEREAWRDTVHGITKCQM